MTKRHTEAHARFWKSLAWSAAFAAFVTAAPAFSAMHPEAEEFECERCHTATNAEGIRVESMASTASHPGFTCGACHLTRGLTTNLHLVRTSVATPNSGTRAVVYTAETGAKSLADGDATLDGLCEVCHTATFRHANSAAGDHRHHAGAACTSCHTHESGFAAPAATCKECHDHAQPQPGAMNRRQIVAGYGVGGDFMQASHHVMGATAATEMVTANDCTVCHSTANHRTITGGVGVDLRNFDTGATTRYDGTAGSAESHCVSCHDDSHVPFSTAKAAKNVSARWANSTHQRNAASCMKCHGDGHGGTRQYMLLGAYALNDNTTYTTAAYALCWTCHSEAKIINQYNHFKDLHKKHTKEKRVPCFVCHDNHGPYDAGEAGLVNFTYAQSRGVSITYTGGKNASTAFTISADGVTGYCYVNCHGKSHSPQSYVRNRTGNAMPDGPLDGGGDTGDTGDVDGTGEPRDFLAYALQNPARNEATFVLHGVGMTGPVHGRVVVYDIGGRIVRSLPAVVDPSRRTVRWDGRDRTGTRAPTGVYLCRFESDRIQKSWRVALVH
ncbi:MAG: hypothetical protein HZA61_10910 [Candidatus Eisenbacteria bacterium]|uniref:T9SS type A sorting domain-containing protein n=1 Tax=Eiseniibacteriota bacterium TaxID=2212470 RepID=A0A933SHH5_UNCEI|nr:hypothetical protein [Candidatus Eisenbacteria bacterium]